ncbi:MAG: cofactor-independent phosphoglycerate mutase [Christensenellaceae bacterium]|jgi:2,3-bisphosphoglycerate-independent phosphoglycerate mutase|nr:cofactor-independent phosphoglycerate mutase [Christensenellaceae bacterium]
MKYAVILGDGMADRPIASLQNKTPIEVASIPNIDALAKLGQTGLVKTVPDCFSPGSDVANLSVIGYAPEIYYSGRSPLEALSMGISMSDTDVAIRCNLVTLGDSPLSMIDYSAGEITTSEANELVAEVNSAFGSSSLCFYPGTSYRHCLIIKSPTNPEKMKLVPPHDIIGKPIAEFLPRGEMSDQLTRLMLDSADVLKKSPVNLKRISEGKNPATNIWLWGAGMRPQLKSFKHLYKLDGAVISAVNLLRGIAFGAGMQSPIVDGATGTLSTNLDGKIKAAIDAFKTGCDYVYLHIEAPDECSHQGDLTGKIKAIERVDYAVDKIWKYLIQSGEDYVLAVLPDHATPISIRTHSREPVPYVVYKSLKPFNSQIEYSEKAASMGIYLAKGQDIIKTMLS